ncbi:MAG: metallophosphoesterase [Burkholderiaceae bacterium]
MTKTPADGIFSELAARVDADLLRCRMEKEGAKEVSVQKRGQNFFFNDQKISFRSLFRRSLKLAGLLNSGRQNALELAVTYHDLRVRDLPVEFDGYRILHLSDLHLDANEFLPTVLIDQIGAVQSDLCVMTGDFRARSFGPIDNCIEHLGEVVRHIKTPIYATLGNHDSIRMVPAIESLGIRLLLNESVPLDHKDQQIQLLGVDDPHYFRSDDLAKAAHGLSRDDCLLLLAHSPELIADAHQIGVSAYLCGHTHGGQICLPGGMPLISNARASWRYSSGSWRYKEMAGYTSRGSGVSIVDVRFNCAPEITVHTLRVG